MIVWPQPTHMLRIIATRATTRANYDTIEKMLLYNCKDMDSELIELIYGLALFMGNERIISIVNLFIRENKVNVNRHSILKNVYLGFLIKNEDCANKRCLSRDDCCTSINFSDLHYLQLEYIHMYWNRFEVKVI